MIPTEAIEAAELAAHDSAPMWRWNDMSRDECREFFTEILEAAAPHMLAVAFDQGQKSGMRHADRLVAAAKIGRHDLPGPLSPNPYRTKETP